MNVLLLFYFPFYTQGSITQLSEQMSTLTDRMDDFTSRIEELNNKLTRKRVSAASSQNIAVQAEASNGSAPTSYFMSGLENGSLTGRISNSSSSSQLARESQVMEEVIYESLQTLTRSDCVNV